LGNIKTVIDLTANGREQSHLSFDTSHPLNAIQTHPEINAVLFSLN
jgi:hypothetical protein